MYFSVEIIFAAASILLLLLERAGFRTTLQLSFRGDLKRETLFVAQWGQAVATPLVALVIWRLEPDRSPGVPLGLIGCVVAASGACFVLKRLLGRVRPNRPQAGRFLGPTLRHENWRESFPSSHSACAMAASVYLATLYPPIVIIMWTLGVTTALLRYVLDAHFPSDVLTGMAIGTACAHLMLLMLGIT